MARIAAARALLERGWGRPATGRFDSDDRRRPQIVEIIRRIVDPNPPPAELPGHDDAASAMPIAQPATDDIIGRAARAVVRDTMAASATKGDPRWRADAPPLASGSDRVIERRAFVPP